MLGARASSLRRCDARNHKPNRGTTWLRYVTFASCPPSPEALDRFLADAVNRYELIARIWSARAGGSCHTARTAAAGAEGFLLSQDETLWLAQARRTRIDRVKGAEPLASFGVVAKWRSELEAIPVPLRLVDEIDQLLRAPRFDDQYLDLSTIAPALSRATESTG